MTIFFCQDTESHVLIHQKKKWQSSNGSGATEKKQLKHIGTLTWYFITVWGFFCYCVLLPKLFRIMVKFSLCLSNHRAMRYRRSGDTVAHILNLDTRCRSSALRPGRFTPRKGVPGTHWIGDWMGPRVGFEAVTKRIICDSDRDPRTPMCHSVA
jgi:hypothetical protein